MHSIRSRALKWLIIAMLVLTLIPMDIKNSNTVTAAGTRLPSGSVMAMSDVTTEYGVPSSLKEVPGSYDKLANQTSKIFPKVSAGASKYWLKDLPFDLKDTKTGKKYAGYCAQSFVYASKKMEAKGVVTDARILKVIETITPNNPQSPTDSQQIAIQLVLWAGLNNNWSPTTFSGGYMSTSTSAYGTAEAVAGHVKKVAAAWSDIIKPPKKKIKTLKLASNESKKAACATDKKSAVASIDFKFVGGGTPDLSSVADITFSGLGSGIEVVKGTASNAKAKLKKFRISPKKSSYYLIKSSGLDKVTTSTVVPKIVYKKGYEPLNEMALIHYVGGANYQPFLMPIKADTKLKSVRITWYCAPPPPIIKDLEVESEAKSTPVRWYNMPSAFGEIKNGSGYNENSVTTEGKYTTSRSQETFEAMNGVPSTERFYVNLGGTEGFLDVKYTLRELEQEFGVQWFTDWTTPTASGTEHFGKTIIWKMRAMHLEKATFKVADDAAVSQGDLDLDLQIINTEKDAGSFSLKPNTAGLKVGPGVGDKNYNLGATKAWVPLQPRVETKAVVGRKAVEADGKEEAYAEGNKNVGKIFAQNDKLVITIKGKKYTFTAGVNKKTDDAFKDGSPLSLDATDDKGVKYFNPIAEKWDVWSHVPIRGYNGNPEDDGGRNIKSKPWLVEDLAIDVQKGNGIYSFEDSEAGNIIDYEAVSTKIKGAEESLHLDVSELQDGKSTGTSTVYPSAKNPIDSEYYMESDKVLLQYTNWQVPVKTGENNLKFKHSGKKPDNNKNANLTDNPTYRSINPILIHNPTTAMYGWVSDIPDSQLQDQRIVSTNDRIVKHPSTQSGNARQYINYDFQLTIPNVAAFNKYWSQASNTSTKAGFEDSDFTYPGTLGKGYKGSSASQIMNRSYENPYLGASGWDVSKWTTAKYVKFPYAVYYYKNTGESGGDTSGFYAAGTWIKLYDDESTVRVGDPTIFNFHVSSEQKDIKNGIIYMMSETINAAEDVSGDPDALYSSAEQYVNGTRNTIDTNIGDHVTERDGEAMSSAANQVNVDVIGRIGNTLASDTSDPAWSSVFWKTNKGKIDTKTPVNKDYGTVFNMYESNVLPNATGFAAYDRFKTIKEWHGEREARHSLPLTTNTTTKGKTDQTIKMGYNVNGSIQTVGDYDYNMWIYPQNQLAGKFNTGNAAQHFKLITSDPFKTGAKYQEYYDSNVNNTLHGNRGVLGKDYKPRYNHILSSSLADPRMKMSPWEKSSATYQKAVQLGSNKKTATGTPSWIVIPKALRTLIGSDTTEGRFGLSNSNGNNSSGAKGAPGSADCTCSYENVQKWNWNYSLPQNTKIWFDQNAKNTSKSGIPKLETPSKDQYIVTSMTFRTKVSRSGYPGQGDSAQTALEKPGITFNNNYLVRGGQSTPDWDLTMFTNTGVNTLPDIQSSTKDVPKGITPSTDPSKPYTWDPSQGGDISAPMLDIVWWNYSKGASTDKDNMGTH